MSKNNEINTLNEIKEILLNIHHQLNETNSKVEDEILSIKEIAQITKISPSTLYKNNGKKDFPRLYRINGKLCSTASKINEWIKTMVPESNFIENDYF